MGALADGHAPAARGEREQLRALLRGQLRAHDLPEPAHDVGARRGGRLDGGVPLPRGDVDLGEGDNLYIATQSGVLAGDLIGGQNDDRNYNNGDVTDDVALAAGAARACAAAAYAASRCSSRRRTSATKPGNQLAQRKLQ